MMKKLLFAMMAVALMGSASSCKKCGYCAYGNGNGNGSAVCSDNSLGPLSGNNYKEAQTNCQAQGGNWVNTK